MASTAVGPVVYPYDYNSDRLFRKNACGFEVTDLNLVTLEDPEKQIAVANRFAEQARILRLLEVRQCYTELEGMFGPVPTLLLDAGLKEQVIRASFPPVDTEAQALAALHDSFFQRFREANAAYPAAGETKYLLTPEGTSLLANGIFEDDEGALMRIHGVFHLPGLLAARFEKRKWLDLLIEGINTIGGGGDWCGGRSVKDGDTTPMRDALVSVVNPDARLKVFIEAGVVVAWQPDGHIFIGSISDVIVLAASLLIHLRPEVYSGYAYHSL